MQSIKIQADIVLFAKKIRALHQHSQNYEQTALINNFLNAGHLRQCARRQNRR